MAADVTVGALLHCLGYEAARNVLEFFPPGLRESLAIEAAEAELTAPDVKLAGEYMAARVLAWDLLSGNEPDEVEAVLAERFTLDDAGGIVDEVRRLPWIDEDRLDYGRAAHALDELSSSVLVRTLSFLPVGHAAAEIFRMRERVVELAMAFEAAGLLRFMAEALATLDPVDIDTMLDLVAEVDHELAAALQARMLNIYIFMKEMSYTELARVLGGEPVEDIASALMEAGTLESDGRSPRGAEHRS